MVFGCWELVAGAIDLFLCWVPHWIDESLPASPFIALILHHPPILSALFFLSSYFLFSISFYSSLTLSPTPFFILLTSSSSSSFSDTSSSTSFSLHLSLSLSSSSLTASLFSLPPAPSLPPLQEEQICGVIHSCTGLAHLRAGRLTLMHWNTTSCFGFGD